MKIYTLSFERRLRKLLSLIITTLVVLASLYVVFTPSVQGYDKESHLYEEFLQSGGCAWDQCPPSFIEDALEETDGLFPSQYYKKDSDEYWKSTCTYSPEVCIY